MRSHAADPRGDGQDSKQATGNVPAACFSFGVYRAGDARSRRARERPVEVVNSMMREDVAHPTRTSDEAARRDDGAVAYCSTFNELFASAAISASVKAALTHFFCEYSRV